MKVQTMKVIVEVMSWLKADFGHEGWDRLVIEETVSKGSTIMDLLHKLAGKYPLFAKKAFALEPKVTFDYCAIIWNGKYLPALAGLDAELKDGDIIKLNPGLYGG